MKFLKVLTKVLVGILLFVIVVLMYFTIREYRPKQIEETSVHSKSSEVVKLDESLKVMTFNIGYSGLGKDEDFVMDGGKKGRANSKEVVLGYLSGIKDTLDSNYADFYLLQEVDRPSRRSYFTNQEEAFMEMFSNYNSVFSLNFKADFVPFPVSFTDYMGKVESGIQTLSKYQIKESFRHQTPGSFAWPVKTVNLKRAIQVNYLKITGSDKLLVLINLHLSAYDDGGMRIEETKYLMELLEKEKEAGNYVIVGGDFNQTYEDVKDKFPDVEGLWNPLILKEESIADGYSFIYSDKATCRSLDKPLLNVDDHHYYIIDGFIISDNVELIDFTNIGLGFTYSDHEPLILEVKLKP